MDGGWSGGDWATVARARTLQALLHGECCRSLRNLLRDYVADFAAELISTGLEIRGGKRLLQRHLVARESHGIGRLQHVEYEFPGGSIRNPYFPGRKRITF